MPFAGVRVHRDRQPGLGGRLVDGVEVPLTERARRSSAPGPRRSADPRRTGGTSAAACSGSRAPTVMVPRYRESADSQVAASQSLYAVAMRGRVVRVGERTQTQDLPADEYRPVDAVAVQQLARGVRRVGPRGRALRGDRRRRAAPRPS